MQDQQTSPHRSTAQRYAALAGSAGCAGVLALLATWLLAIACTDRFLLTQYLFWFNPAIVIAAGCTLLVAYLLRRFAGNTQGVRPLAWLFVGALILMTAREFGAFRTIVGLLADSPPKGRAIRVAHWNLSQFDTPERINIGKRLSTEGTPDIVFISMQNNRRLWEQISAAMKEGTKDEITLVNAGPDKVFSRFPARAVSYVSVRLSGKDDALVSKPPAFVRSAVAWAFRTANVQGRSLDEVEDATIIAFSFDTTALIGKPTTAWFIDMPSNPVASRVEIATRIAARTAALQKAGTLPAADFIIGDFNIPAGSHSLEVYAPGFSDAASTAGFGRLATWPRPSTFLHIDHLLVSPSWRAADYRIIDPGTSEHMAQTAVLWPAAK